MKYFTRPFLFIVILVSLEGCFATRKACLRKFPPKSSIDTIVKFSVRDSLVFRDTTIIVSIPGETIIDSIIIPCPPPSNYIPDTLTVSTKFATAQAWFDGAIKLKLIQEGDLEVRLKNAIQEKYKWMDKYEQILKKEVVTVKAKIPLIYKIALWLWIIVFMLILFSFMHFLKQRYFPKILP